MESTVGPPRAVKSAEQLRVNLGASCIECLKDSALILQRVDVTPHGAPAGRAVLCALVTSSRTYRRRRLNACSRLGGVRGARGGGARVSAGAACQASAT